MTEVLTNIGKVLSLVVFVAAMLGCCLAPLVREAQRDEWRKNRD